MKTIFLPQISILLWLVLLYLAVVDWKQRKISAPALAILGWISVLGCITDPTSAPFRIVGFLITFLTLLFLALLGAPLKGGDIKYLAITGAALGIDILMISLFIGAALGMIWAKLKKQKSIPLASFTGIGYFLFLILR